MKKCFLFLLTILFIISAGILIGCDEFEVNSGNINNVETQTSESNGAADSQIYSIGDTAVMSNFNFTVNSIRTDLGTEAFPPDDGNEFFYVDVTIENTSSESQHISCIIHFEIVDSDGRSVRQALFARTNGLLGGEIQPGRQMTGEYAVEAPIGIEGLELEFTTGGTIRNRETVIFALD